MSALIKDISNNNNNKKKKLSITIIE